jgi:hypothetical protein
VDLFLPSSFFWWCQSTHLSVWTNASGWGSVVIRMVHFAGLGVLMAGVAEIDLRILGVMKRGQSVGDVAAELRPYIRASLGVVVATGMVQFMAQAVRYSHSVAFLGTLLLFGAAVTTHEAIVRRASGAGELAPVRHRKLAAYLSLASWLGVLVAERGLAGLP